MKFSGAGRPPFAIVAVIALALPAAIASARVDILSRHSLRESDRDVARLQRKSQSGVGSVPPGRHGIVAGQRRVDRTRAEHSHGSGLFGGGRSLLRPTKRLCRDLYVLGALTG